jgi:hypothetical protein
MRLRSKILLTVGLSCLSSAVLAGGAMADGGHKNKPGLEVELRGLVTGLTAATPTTPGSITVSPGGTLAPWTCALKPGADTTGITLAPPSNVKVKCRTKNGVLTAKRVRTTTNMTGKVKLEATGLVTAFTALTPGTLGPPPTLGTPGSITIDAGITGLPLPVTCAITDRTRLRSVPVVGVDTAKIECKSKDDALVAKKIKVKHPKVPAMYGSGSGHKKGHH